MAYSPKKKPVKKKAAPKKTIKKPKKRSQKKDECFITTACVSYYGLKDNCYQLQTLRSFRDNYLLGILEDKKLVKQYYKLAPILVTKLNTDCEKEVLYKEIYKNINSACFAIEQKEFEQAKLIYIDVVKALLNRYN